MLDLLIPEVQDEFSQENFKRIRDLALKDPLFGGTWVKKEIEFTKAVTNLKVAHGLSFVPRDILVMSKTGAGAITVNYEKNDITNIDVTTTGVCIVRLLIGRMGG